MNLRWIVALGAREVHFTPLFDVDPHFRSDSNFSVGALGEGAPLVNLRWIVALGAREVHFTPFFDVGQHFRSDSNSWVGILTLQHREHAPTRLPHPPGAGGRGACALSYTCVYFTRIYAHWITAVAGCKVNV